ncbi:hypothetical protein [Nostoc sp. LEGE 12450]|uniref:hypothetical protein n=1 Tax=Nostoc sp. LEGE 12450 TaxID=1828643 RepID=UPI001880767D|nr:hypothetical protein [Nostoc sp. LEGE 12450]
MSLDRIYSVKNPPPGASKKSGRRTIMLSGVFVNIVQSMTCDHLRWAGTPSPPVGGYAIARQFGTTY